MKIFIVVKVPRGDKERQEIARRLADFTRQAGHEPFVAFQEIIDRGIDRPDEFMPFARQQIHSSDLVVVLYHPQLRGGLIEMGIAYDRGIPIWLLHKPGERVSSSALGCAGQVVEYTGLDDLITQLTAQLCKHSNLAVRKE